MKKRLKPALSDGGVPPPPYLASEAGTVQWPLIRHAESVGWAHVTRAEAERKRRGTAGLFFYPELEEALLALNPDLVTRENLGSILSRLEAIPPTLDGNRQFLEWLRGKMTVYDEKEKRERAVRLVDFANPAANRLQVTAEWAYDPPGRKGNRADIVFLVNGIPVAIVENKSPRRPDALEEGIKQLRRYERETPELMAAPQLFNITHLIHYAYGVTWSYGRRAIYGWKAAPDESYGEAVRSFFRPPGFLQTLKEWILFFVKDDELQKTILRQHQTRAALKVVERCADTTKKTGLVWHTQGSGKTFTLLTAARLILEDGERFPGATVLLVVDRNELEGQMGGWVDRLLGELQKSRIKIERAHSQSRLQDLFDADFRGLILSMIHKFDGVRANSCTRRDVFVLIDEAHRSVGGDLGNYLLGALPNATLIGFTGTPIDKTAQGKGTFKTFGGEDDQGYLDKYSIRESVEDGTTVPLRHQLAPTETRVPEELLDREFFALTEKEGVSDIDELNKILDRAVGLKSVLKADDRIEKVAAFVAAHFKSTVEPLGYKAMLVAVDREACALYKQALDRLLPREWSVPVYTANSADVEDRPLAAKYQLDETREKNARKLFLKPDKEPKILIVTDKLLTGYDAPILYCMYLDKPMRDHVLLQAVARVNRPYEDARGKEKPCGLIIDFIGVLRNLNKALRFDSAEVSGVIEDLDLLLARFIAQMGGPAEAYLHPEGEGRDAQLESLLYGRFFQAEARRAFYEFFRELESLYEILSPSPELRPYLDRYRFLADLYAMLRNAYDRRQYLTFDLAAKTEALVREHATTSGPGPLSAPVEYDLDALEGLRASAKPDAEKILNLVRQLENAAREKGAEQPFLIPLSERALSIMASLQERQLSTREALDELLTLARQQQEAQRERESLGLSPGEYAAFWLLRQEGLPEPGALATEIDAAFGRYPDFARNPDELRQVKAELYRTLLRHIDGERMVEIAKRLIAQRGRP